MMRPANVEPTDIESVTDVLGMNYFPVSGIDPRVTAAKFYSEITRRCKLLAWRPLGFAVALGMARTVGVG
jgi:hypothetical protein